MLQQYKNRVNIGVGLGFVLTTISKVIERQYPELHVLALATLLAGVILIIWGCVGYAKGKGYSGYWGALCVFWILGFIILAVLPDRHKAS